MARFNSSLQLIPVSAFNDNYIWLLHDDHGHALVVDPGEAAPVMQVLQEQELILTSILITHHHHDHTGGVSELVEHTGAYVVAPDDSRIPYADHRAVDKETITIKAPATRFKVLATPGHTSSHVTYYGENHLFCGDTLFSIGCGRLFEGSPAQMLASLERLAQLPAETLICCAHEYTLANGTFAQTVDGNNPALIKRMQTAQALREKDQPTVPSTLDEELQYNPFLRSDSPAIRTWSRIEGDDIEARIKRFAHLRQAKDDF